MNLYPADHTRIEVALEKLWGSPSFGQVFQSTWAAWFDYGYGEHPPHYLIYKYIKDMVADMQEKRMICSMHMADQVTIDIGWTSLIDKVYRKITAQDYMMEYALIRAFLQVCEIEDSLGTRDA